jgi:hypothetical protein
MSDALKSNPPATGRREIRVFISSIMVAAALRGGRRVRFSPWLTKNDAKLWRRV